MKHLVVVIAILMFFGNCCVAFLFEFLGCLVLGCELGLPAVLIGGGIISGVEVLYLLSVNHDDHP